MGQFQLSKNDNHKKQEDYFIKNFVNYMEKERKWIKKRRRLKNY